MGPAGPALCRPDVIAHYARARVVARRSYLSRSNGRAERSSATTGDDYVDPLSLFPFASPSSPLLLASG